MSVDDARQRLSTRPKLKQVASERWLLSQAGLPSENFHPLYGLMEVAAQLPGVDAFLDGLESTLGSEVSGRLRQRATRLVKGQAPRFSDYWSAVDELSIGTCLTRCGFNVRFGQPELGEPDLIAERDEERLLLELTSVEKTNELETLQLQITAGWVWPVVARLHLGRITYRPTSQERRAITDRVQAAASRRPTEDTEVDLASIVDPSLLRVEVSPSFGPGFVSSSADSFFSHYDPVPDIQATVEKKRQQIKHHPGLVVAVCLNAATSDPYMWSMRSTVGSVYGTATPSLTCAPNVFGVLAFLRAIPGERPLMPIWLRNVAYEPLLLAPVLDCLGASR